MRGRLDHDLTILNTHFCPICELPTEEDYFTPSVYIVPQKNYFGTCHSRREHSRYCKNRHLIIIEELSLCLRCGQQNSVNIHLRGPEQQLQLTWQLCAKRLGIPKDVARMICRMIVRPPFVGIKKKEEKEKSFPIAYFIVIFMIILYLLGRF